jgi:hypothetical protein
MVEYKHFLEEAAKRDHRKLGRVRYLISDLTTGTRFILFPRLVSWKLFLPSPWNENLQYAPKLYPLSVSRTWIPGSWYAKHVQFQTLGNFWSLAKLQRRHVPLDRG